MPRYYFDIREGARFTPGDEGLEFPDLKAAEQEAREAAASIAQHLLPKGDLPEVTLELRNEHGQRVLTVTVTMRVDRLVPAPTALTQ